MQANYPEVLRQLNKDSRHRPSTVTQAMMECPIESVDPPLPLPVPAAAKQDPFVTKTNHNHQKIREPEAVVYELIFLDGTTEQEMEDYILEQFDP